MLQGMDIFMFFFCEYAVGKVRQFFSPHVTNVDGKILFYLVQV